MVVLAFDVLGCLLWLCFLFWFAFLFCFLLFCYGLAYCLRFCCVLVDLLLVVILALWFWGVRVCVACFLLLF